MGYLADRYRRTTLGSRRAGDDRKTAFINGTKKQLDPAGVFLKDQPKANDHGTKTWEYQKMKEKKGLQYAQNMKCGGKVKKMSKGGQVCRGMGAATSGGKWGKDG